MKIRSILVCVFCLSLLACLESSRAAPEVLASKYRDQVVLYSTAWCGYCQKTRELFKHKRIAYVEIDIESSDESYQEFKALGGGGIPLVLAKGRVVEGYAPKAFLEVIRGSVE